MKKLLILAFALFTLTANAQTRNAEYPGGQNALYAFIDQNLVTPKEAVEQQVYGTIFVRVEVNKKGKPTKVEVTKPSGYDYLDNEAVRVVKLINEWTPALKKGKPIDGEVIVAVDFEQEYDPTNVVSASYPGGDEAMQAFFDKNIVYPDELKEKRIFGTIYVEMDIDENGKASNIHVTSPSDYPSLDAEAVRVVSMVDKWQPATNNGIPFANLYVVPVEFKLAPIINTGNGEQSGGNVGETTSGKNNNNQGKANQQMAKMPSYPGGMIEMTSFISKNKKYPEKELKNKVEGDVTVIVVIDEEGNVVNPRIKTSVSQNLDAEAIRVVKLMPKWEPARDTEGKPMKCEMPITVNFRTPRAIDGVPFH